MSSKKYKNIYRLDLKAKRTFGWRVRIRFRGKAYDKFFADKKHGGEQNSLDAAIAWRNGPKDSIEKVSKRRVEEILQAEPDNGILIVKGGIVIL